MGIKLNNPLVASSSPLSQKIQTIEKMEEAGLSAVVLYSLFEEQITQESLNYTKTCLGAVNHMLKLLHTCPIMANSLSVQTGTSTTSKKLNKR